MRIDVKAAQAAAKEDKAARVILSKGWYAATITEAEDKEWDSGARGLVLRAKVWYTDDEGKKRAVKNRWQLCYQKKDGSVNRIGNKQVFALVQAAGAEVDGGNVEVDELEGAKVDVYLRKVDAKDEYPEKNEAGDFEPLGTKTKAKPDAAAKAATAAIKGQAKANAKTEVEQAKQSEDGEDHPFDDPVPF